ncbi:hypothetical protein BDY24DRAFT_438773, partial [Mrakia frigida]|uniref:uncharacterized protein n=1 Tax=Mrakia frigida TaxID=29902 RepID=UPI003FCBF822
CCSTRGLRRELLSSLLPLSLSRPTFFELTGKRRFSFKSTSRSQPRVPPRRYPISATPSSDSHLVPTAASEVLVLPSSSLSGRAARS